MARVVSERDALEYSVACARGAEAQATLDGIQINRRLLWLAEREARQRVDAASKMAKEVLDRNGLPATAIIMGPGAEWPLGTVIDTDGNAWDDAIPPANATHTTSQ